MSIEVAEETTVPYALHRVGVVMEPDPTDPAQVEGVLNPGTGRGPDGKLYLLPRLVAAGNVSRIGLAGVRITDGVPVGVERAGVVLAPDAGWERARNHGGVEDPRITWMPALGLHLMTYVAYGPLGPRPALATSTDLVVWQRLGPLHFEYQAELDTDLNLFPNKDVVYFPESIPGPDGRPCFAALHRPTWDLDVVAPGIGVYLPAAVTDDRPGIWISYVPVDDVTGDLSRLTHLRDHRPLAMPRYPFEALKIGAGPPPLRVPEGWLVIHHGVSGQLVAGVDHQPLVHYAAGAMILSADDPAVVLARTSEPLLSAELDEERSGIVPNVVFPTAIEKIDGRYFVFYGMADSRIGVASLDRIGGSSGRMPSGRMPSGRMPSAASGVMRRSITVGPGRRVATVLLAVALATSLLAPVAVAAPAPNAPRAGQAAAPLTNLAHLDFLSAQVAVPNMAAHSTYRLAQEPRVGVLWVYAQANDDGTFTRLGGGNHVADTYGHRASVGYLRQCRATGDVHAKEQAYQQLRGLTYLQTLTGPKAGEAVLWIQPDGSLHASATPADSPDPYPDLAVLAKARPPRSDRRSVSR